MSPASRSARWMFAWRRVLVSPAVRFAALGALLFAGQRIWSTWTPPPTPHERAPIVVSRADIERWTHEWERRTGAAPTAAEEQALIDEQVDDEVLLREALARGFDRDDRVVRARLVRLGRFLGLGDGAGDEVVERDARDLAFDQSDLAVRRHLIEMMRLAASKTPVDPPSDAELHAYYEAHLQRFTSAGRVRLAEVFLSRDRRRDALEGDANALLQTLRAHAVSPQDAASLGDPFPRGNTLPPATPQQLDQMFGPGFSDAVAALPLHTWSGPVASSYGLHLVWIDAREPPAPLGLASVHNQVLHAVLRERGEERLRENLRALRARYDVQIAPGAASPAVSG